MLQTLSPLFDRDLQKLKDEVSAYPAESQLWILMPGISNSGGNLCLHLCGNLQHFIGAALGGTGYVRQRDLEFSRKDVPRTDMLAEIERTRQVVATTLAQFPESDLLRDFPFPKHDTLVSAEHMLLHLYAHLNYHLGQINYHRRMIG
jgi:uncharacterized damage-inducible protein DinB